MTIFPTVRSRRLRRSARLRRMVAETPSPERLADSLVGHLEERSPT